MSTVIKPSDDSRNHHQDDYQMKSELELLRNLAEADDDTREGRAAQMKKTFDDIRTELMEWKTK